MPHSVLIDCSASQAIADRYADWLRRGIHVITPNKRAHSGPMPYYEELKRLSRTSRTHFLYEATVGAGLPVIQTLEGSRRDGRRDSQYQRHFLGHARLLVQPVRREPTVLRDRPRGEGAGLHGARSARRSLRDGRGAQGRHPRARGRICSLELADIEVESLAPAALANASVEEFLDRLADFDAPMAERVTQAQRNGQVLRYVADVDVRAGTRKSAAAELSAKPSVREHQLDRQYRPVRHGTLLRQSAHRARSRGGTGSHGRRYFCRFAAPVQHAERARLTDEATPMRYQSTRSAEQADLVEAIMRGLAVGWRIVRADGMAAVLGPALSGTSVAEIGAQLLQPFFADSLLEDALPKSADETFDFPLPLVPVIERELATLAVLELFHGPTAAFKDFGARFLAATMERALRLASDTRPLTILVATSGDTGGAVAAAFEGRAGIRVGILFPRGQVSARQQHQLTCWGQNVRAYEVEGSFDQCQALVKAAFGDPGLRSRHRLSAANSINIGRLLPQVAYHAAASLWHWRQSGEAVGMIVPTGNLGNGMACIWAKEIGLPIREVVLAVNANRSIPDYLATGRWQPRASRPTLASAMDVGNPSNMERLRHLLPDFGALGRAVEAYSVDDESIRLQIRKDHARFARTWCPHTATGFSVYDRLPDARKSGARGSWRRPPTRRSSTRSSSR